MGWFDFLFGKKTEVGDACIACDSTHIDLAAPGVYVCMDCGYEGGDNRMEFERLEKFERLRKLPADERHARAGELLEHARLGLIAATGSVRAAQQSVALISSRHNRNQQDDEPRSLSLEALTATLEVVNHLEGVLALSGSLDTLDHLHKRFSGSNWKGDIKVANTVLRELGPLYEKLDAKHPRRL